MSPYEDRVLERLSASRSKQQLQRSTSKDELEVYLLNNADAAVLNNTRPNLSKRSSSCSVNANGDGIIRNENIGNCNNLSNGSLSPPSDELYQNFTNNGKYHSTFESSSTSSQLPSSSLPSSYRNRAQLQSSYISPMTIRHTSIKAQQRRNINSNSGKIGSSSNSKRHLGRKHIFLSFVALIVLSCSTFIYFTLNVMKQANIIENNENADNYFYYPSLLRSSQNDRPSNREYRPRIITLRILDQSSRSISGSIDIGRRIDNYYYRRQVRLPKDNDEILQNITFTSTISVADMFELPFVNKSTIYTTDDDDNINNVLSSSLSKELKIKEVETAHKNECLPMAEWQTASYPNCNSIHEIDMSSSVFRKDKEENLSFLGQGWFRSTWKYQSESSSPTPTPTSSKTTTAFSPPAVVLKTLRIEREFLDEYFDLHRRDAVAMERLTFSPFIVNVHGYCGQSAINELAEGIVGGAITNLEQLNRRLRGKEEDPQALFLKLQLASGVALGLAHIHNVHISDESGGRSKSIQSLLFEHTDPNSSHSTTGFGRSMATMAHYDINPRNIQIMRDGSPKINDFNIAEFLTYNRTTNASCGFRSRMHEPWWRAPEEMDMTSTAMVTEKVDVYALGEVLFHILTTHSPRGKMKKHLMEDARSLVRDGIRPTMREPYLSGGTDGQLKQNRIVKAFMKALDLCFEENPKKRGTAIQVARILYTALSKEELIRHKTRTKVQTEEAVESMTVTKKKATTKKKKPKITTKIKEIIGPSLDNSV